MYKTKVGYTLVEVLIGLSLMGLATTSLIIAKSEENESNRIEKFIMESYDIVQAVDHRIAIDGYDPVLWSKTSWVDEDEIVNELINKELTSKYLTNCSGGDWDPSLNSEHETKLINCNHWEERKSNGESLSAELVMDSAGFIQNFNLFISYPLTEDFSSNFLNLKKGINAAELKMNQELSGSHYIDLVSISTGNDIEASDCLNNLADCSIKFSIDRNGGNEYLRADGGNSMIGEHLTFIETKGQAPMKCVRWKNTARDGSGAWTKELIEDCGIGIYKNDPFPVMVDVVADTGTFKNVVLDKDCEVYRWDGLNVIDTGNKSPCGSVSDYSDVIQVVDSVNTREMVVEDLFVNEIFSNEITSEYARIENKLMTDIISSNNLTSIQIDSETTFKELVKMEKDLLVAGSVIVTTNVQANGNVIADTHIISKKELLLEKVNVENSSCGDFGSLSRTTDGTLLNCVSGVWRSAIQDTSPVGSIQLWASTTIPDGWLEMNGQSTSGYPDLQALIGSNVPDMRGVVARGLDRGRGLDVGRTLGTYQEDTMQRITGTFESRSHRARLNHLSGAFSDGGYLGSDDGWDGWVGSQRKIVFDSASQTRTSNETRMKNVALIYIIKAEIR